MSATHRGNLLNEVTFEEHDGLLNAKKVSLVSSATIYAVTSGSNVNTGNVTLNPGPNWVGLATVQIANAAGNATLNPSPNFIGIVTVANPGATGNVTLDSGSKTGLVGTVTIQDGGNSITIDGNVGVLGNVTISDSKGYIGLVTVTQASTTRTLVGNITLDSGSKTGIVGNVTLSDSKTNIGLVTLTGGTAWADPKTYIGLVTITGSLSPAAGNITLDPGSKTGIVGNVTLSDAKTFIGLVTTQAADPKGFIGLVTLGGGTAWADPKGYIGLVTITGALSPAAGNVTLDPGSKTGLVGTVTIQDGGNSITIDGNVGILGNVTLSDSKTYIGLVTTTDSRLPILGSGTTISGYISTASGFPQLVAPMFGSGNRWAETGSGVGQVAPIGNVTLSDAKTFVGLVTVGGIGTVTLADPKGYIGLVSVSHAAWADPKGYIGLVTITGALSPAAGNITLDPGSKTGIVGNVTLSDAKTFIGLVTTQAADPKGFIGLVTLGGGTAWTDPKTFIGLITAVNGQAWPDPKTFIGLTTAVNGQAWPDPKTYLGLVTVGGIGTVTLADPKGFIGLVTLGGGTAWADPKSFIGLVTVGNKSALQKTVQTELKSLSSLAAYKVDQSSVLDVSTKFGVTVFIDYAPLLASIPSGGTVFTVEASEKASGSDTWRPIQTFVTNTVAASVASVAVKTTAGATIAQVLSNVGFEAGDMIYFANVTAIANAEFAKVAWISGASIVLFDGMTTAQDFAGVWNKCQSFVAPLDVTPYNRIRVAVNNAVHPGLPITINWRAAAITADTVG